VLVSHDARLIRHAECQLWVCDAGNVLPYAGEYDDYKESLMATIAQAEAALDEVMSARAAAEEAARMAAVRERARKLKEMRAAAAAGGAAAS
jgi:ATPase subunit of ABC transporter with duplicated ATPase domains